MQMQVLSCYPGSYLQLSNVPGAVRHRARQCAPKVPLWDRASQVIFLKLYLCESCRQLLSCIYP